MNQLFHLLKGVAIKEWIILKRYWLNTLAGLLATYCIFLFIFIGGTTAFPRVADSIDGIIVGYFLSVLAIAAYQDNTSKITRESQWGTLEKLYLSPLGFMKVILANLTVTIVYSFLFSSAVLVLMLVTSNESLALDPVTIVPIATLAIFSIIGVGLAFAGLAVLYKRIGQLVNIFQFIIFGLVAAPLSGHPAVYALPLAQGSKMLQVAMKNGTSLWEFPVSDILLLLIVAISYLLGGSIFFVKSTNRARRLGILDDY